MSDTVAALKAAKEVQADTLAPELYRQATEWFFRAKREYKFKNFREAFDYARKARLFAEEAEFFAIRGGGNRASAAGSDPLTEGPPPPPVMEEDYSAKPDEYSTEGDDIYFEAYSEKSGGKGGGGGGGALESSSEPLAP